jgi:small-conductance mechanosensitive channel
MARSQEHRQPAVDAPTTAASKAFDRHADAQRIEQERSQQRQTVEQNADVQRELERSGAGTRGKPEVERGRKARIVLWLVLLLACAVAHYLLRMEAFDVLGRYLAPTQRAVVGAMAACLVMALARAIEAFVIEPNCNRVTQFNLKHVVRLATWLLLALILVSVLFANWYAAAASLGLISLVLGFALQTPITSLIGWVYILVREPYRVGDRIRIGDALGDVIDVNYLDTTLWELGGEHLAGFHPSGRVIKLPNATVLKEPVYNYSWPLFPYIWNEIRFQVGYDSDLDFVAETMQEVAEDEVGEAMMARVRTYREVLARTPVDAVQVGEKPTVIFRVSDNTWLEAVVRYVVDPKESGPVKTRLLRAILQRLQAEPERVRFPKGDLR